MIRELLEIAASKSEGATMTQLVYGSNSTFTRIRVIVNELVERDLLRKYNKGDITCYERTLRGTELCNMLNSARLLFAKK